MNQLAENVLNAYRNADPKLKRCGLKWYPTAREVASDVAKMAGIPFENGAAILAVLSPQTNWETNVRWAYAVADAHRKGDPLPNMGLPNNLKRARIALTDLSDVERTKGTLKVHNFYGSIIGRPGAVCIDRHAVRIAANDDDVKITLTDRVYREYAEAYLEAAGSLKRKTADVQAVTWCDYRGVAS